MVSNDRTGGNRHILKYKKCHLNIKAVLFLFGGCGIFGLRGVFHFFYCEGGQTQAAQSSCEVPILGDIPRSTGYGPEQPDIVDPGLNGGWVG